MIITGASSGIGEAAAGEFAGKGASVVLVARNKDKLYRAEQSMQVSGDRTLAVQCDVSKKKEVAEMARLVEEKFGTPDILVNNAGFAVYGRVRDLSIEDIEAQMATNYTGMVYCTKAFLSGMLDRGSGHIVNVASAAASFGLPGIAAYSASKFAMLGFSEGLGHELVGTGVGITVVSPIGVKTSFFDGPSFSKMRGRPPLSLSPKTVARAIVGAASSRRREIMVPFATRGAVWAKHTIPYVVNPAVGSIFRRALRD
ncbi:short-chain alcohol dehydrogenase [Cenarchaeum symbiosum A]|uniref:Short-chain alcohol dehydrogenase n=1 Tax=Cenarchaeum symbiosum (strain A) TaxID=414004 RepID=A0RYU1_CENSY|nr:short-chain alcohol dehydrogenase [Cenarchaeum symbiosum A]